MAWTSGHDGKIPATVVPWIALLYPDATHSVFEAQRADDIAVPASRATWNAQGVWSPVQIADVVTGVPLLR